MGQGRHRCIGSAHRHGNGVRESPLVGLDECHGSSRQAAGGHAARARSHWAAARRIHIFAADCRRRFATGIGTATARSVALHGCRSSRQEGVGRQCHHQRQAEKPHDDHWLFMGPNGSHDREHKISTTMCQLKKSKGSIGRPGQSTQPASPPSTGLPTQGGPAGKSPFPRPG